MAQPAQQEPAQSTMARGIELFKARNYVEAAMAFQVATQRDPGNPQAHLSWGTAYMVQWLPGEEESGNANLCLRARKEFQAVVAIDPASKVAISSLASLAFNQAKAVPMEPGKVDARNRLFDEAETWYRRLIELDSKDKAAFYWLGVIGWERFNRTHECPSKP